MQKVVIAKYKDNQGTSSDEFRLGIVIDCNDPTLDPIAAIKSATAEFCTTPRGKKVLEETNGSFNYNNFVNEVPDTICKKHGFTVVSATLLPQTPL